MSGMAFETVSLLRKLLNISLDESRVAINYLNRKKRADQSYKLFKPKSFKGTSDARNRNKSRVWVYDKNQKVSRNHQNIEDEGSKKQLALFKC